MICKVKKCIKEWRKTEEQNINEGYLNITAVQSGVRIISSNIDFPGAVGQVTLDMCCNIHFWKVALIVIFLTHRRLNSFIPKADDQGSENSLLH